MAHTINVTKILDTTNAKHAIFQIFLMSDGVSGELNKFTIIDPVIDLGFSKGTPTLAVVELWFEFIGFNVRLEYGGLTQYPIWVMPSSASDNNICFSEFGGLKDRSGIDGNGKLQITTTGFNVM